MSSQLKPCPFCGGVVSINRINHRTLGTRDFWFLCNGCGAYIRLSVNSKYVNATETEKEAIKTWNERVDNG